MPIMAATHVFGANLLTIACIRRAARAAPLILVCLTAPALAADAVKAAAKTYAISGQSGIELYRSIGENGPSGAIAHTAFKLTWKRLFDERNGDCHLVHMRPQLAITYILPQPKGALPPKLKSLWQAFIKGVREHEAVHARMIQEMVKSAEASVAGLSVVDDPTCARIKKEVSRRIDAATGGYKERSRQFDRMELSDGGNVHQLILQLVNEGASRPPD